MYTYFSCTFSTGSQTAVTTSPDGSARAQGSGLVAPPPHAQMNASASELDAQQIAAPQAHAAWPHAYTLPQWQVVAPPVVPSTWWECTLDAVIPPPTSNSVITIVLIFSMILTLVSLYFAIAQESTLWFLYVCGSVSMVVWSAGALVSGKYQLVHQLVDYFIGLWATLAIVLALGMLVVQANLMFRPAQL